MKRLRKYLSLAPAERRLLLEAVLLIGVVRAGLTLFPFGGLRRILARLACGYARVPMPSKRIAWVVAAAGRRTPGATCLVQALVAQVLLAQHGHVAQLRIGVTRAPRWVEAHAWLERNGRLIFGEPGELGYTILR